MVDEADGADPTVYLPYRVRIELVRALPDPAQPDSTVERLDRLATQVTMAPGFVFVGDQGGGSLNIPVEDVRSLQVVVTARPADYALLRERYPHAYDAWENHVLDRFQTLGRLTTLAQLADETGRPPHHLVIKAREIGHDVPEDSGVDSTPRYSDPFVADHYLVQVGTHHTPRPSTVDVLARHSIDVAGVYRIGSWGFAAHLPADKAKRLAADPDVEIEPDTGDRLAPHDRVPPDDRVPGSYLVVVRRTTRPATVAARAGVIPERVGEKGNYFFADLTDAQLQAVLRDPDVNLVEDNAFITIDD